MKKNLLMMMMLGVAMTAGAQKIDSRLTEIIEKSAATAVTSKAGVQGNGAKEAYRKRVKELYSVDYNADGSVKALGVTAYLKEGAECPTEKLEQMGIKVNSTFDNVAFLSVPAGKLAELESVEEIILAVPDGKVKPMNMEARTATKADKAGNAIDAKAAGLPQAYTGKGVVLGIIDMGIDFNHVAFKDAQGNSRVKKALVAIPGTSSQFLEYDAETISEMSSDSSTDSHGTHTAGIAAGSAVTDGTWKWQGVAPETDIVLVGVAPNGKQATVSNAIEEVFKYATEVGKPAVVSISLGNMDQLHDGSEITAKKVKALTESGTKQGRVVVISTANAADNNMSIFKQMGAAAADGWQLKAVMGITKTADGILSPYNSYSNADMIAYASDGKDFTAQIGMVNIKTGELITDATKINEHFISADPTEDPDLMMRYQLKKGNAVNINGKKVVTYTTGTNNSALMDSEDLRLVLLVKGVTEGAHINVIRTDDNAAEFGFYIPDMLADKGYTAGMPDIAFNAGTCDQSVISVGSYITRLDWTNYKNEEQNYSTTPSKITKKPQVIGAISDFSSFGLSDTGLTVPTMVAPGHFMLSGYNSYDDTYFEKNGSKVSELANDGSLAKSVSSGGRKSWFAYEQGTSMSTPHAAGIIALWMQADPTLTANKIREILQETCVRDQYITDPLLIPSGNVIQAGYGKIDAMAGLKKIKGISAIDMVSANGERQATPATMYSVDAPVYNMMGQRVEKYAPGLVIYKGRKYLNR